MSREQGSTEYPSDVPKVAFANDIDRCVRCSYVWLDPCDPSQPDTNHCPPMLETASTWSALPSEGRLLVESLIANGGVCPFFEPRET